MQNSKLHIRDLKAYLDEAEISPERFATDVQLSHMTIRRWLRRKDHQEIHEKYHSLLAPILMRKKVASPSVPGAFCVSELMAEIEKSGQEFKDIDKLDSDLSDKLKSSNVDPIFVRYCKTLLSAIKSGKTSLKGKAIATGALIYFISPIDLIPDHIPIVGYLDDLAVLSLAVESLTKQTDQKQTKIKKAMGL